MGDRAIFVDDSNETRLSGELAFPESTPTDVLTVQADGSIAAAPGGGFTPARNVGQTELDFAGLAVDNTSVPIPFTFGDGDEAMIDLTDPTIPVPTAAGIYAYTLIVRQLAGGSSAPFIATLVVDDDYYSITEGVEVFGAVGVLAVGVFAVTWFCTAGSAFHAAIQNQASDTFDGNLYVQKIA